MSENTQPYLSQFRPVSYFFTEKNKINQNPNQVFGPINENSFRLTSSFSVSGEAMAYAICSGQVLIQPQTDDPTRVNLILRPYKQPILGLPVKYFVYRGLKRSDFFEGNKVIKNTSVSELIHKVWKDFQNFHGDSTPDFYAKYVGYDPEQPDSLPLNNLFFKESMWKESTETHPFEIPMAQEGFSLGHFTGTQCGIDVIIDYGEYKLPDDSGEFPFNLKFARAKENILSTESETSEYLKKVKKEQSIQFLDIAAYYGFHTENGIVKTKDKDYKNTDIYNQVLSPFISKNRIYLYIQSNRGRSYNFYGNYAISESNLSCLKIGTSEDSLQEQIYGMMGWPVFITNRTGENGKLFLQLSSDYNPQTLLFGQVAQIESSSRNNFIDSDTLLHPSVWEIISNDEDSTPLPNNFFTRTFQLYTPSLDPDTPISNFNLLIYQGNKVLITQKKEEEDPEYIQSNYTDDVLGLLNAQAIWSCPTNEKGMETVTDNRLALFSMYYNKQNKSTSASRIVAIHDRIETEKENEWLKRVTYLTEPYELLNNPVSFLKSTSSNTVNTSTNAAKQATQQTYQLPEAFYYERQLFTDGMETITGLLLKCADGSIPNKVLIGITEEENERLTSLIINQKLKNPRLFLVDLFEEGNELTSIEQVIYQKYSLGVTGETETGSLQLFLPDETINIFSIDGLFHFSKRYSENTSEYVYDIKELKLNLKMN